MSNSELQQIVNRLETVEKQNKKLKTTFLFFTLVSIVCLSLFLFVSNEKQAYAIESETIPDVIKAKKFVVVNDKGEPMVVIGNSKIGGIIFITDKDGKLTACIGNSEYGGKMEILNKDDEMVFSVSSNKEGGFMEISNKDGKRVFNVSNNKKGGMMFINDKDGKFTTIIAIGEYGGEMVIFNKTSEGIILLDIDEYGNGNVKSFKSKVNKQILKTNP